MKSIVTNQFPLIVWRDDKKYLWNPIRKQALKNRPEERIRLRVIEYLLEAGWSKHRISTEEGITSTRKEKLRADLICYTDSFDPCLLVECKASNINISNQTAEQIARYNDQVNAPFLLILNGRADFWYAFKDDKRPVLQNEIPEPFRSTNPNEVKPFNYWISRGFAGKKAAPELRIWLTNALNTSLKSKEGFRYLSFKKKLSDVDLNHYYSIFSFPDHRIALAFIATAFGGSRLIAIENRNGKNTGVLEINLDLLFNELTPNASFYSKDGRKNIDIHEQFDWNEKKFQLEPFSNQMNEWLKEVK